MESSAQEGGGESRKNLVLAAMIFAVAMTFIDQTIVSIAIPQIQDNLHLSETGVQWVINGYLLSLAALFAFGGRLADIAGHRSMVLLGIFIFATCSALCGATPTGDAAETWIVVFRVLQGAGAAIMFPAALAIVIDSFPVRERGKAMAIFFGIAGGLTSVGPIAGGYLSEWTWRAIFWINIPVAIIAVVLTLISKPNNVKHPAPVDYRGLVLITGGMGLAVLGLQESATWGWDDAATWGSIVAGVALLVAFVLYELRATNPLIEVRIFENRAFAIDNAVLFIISIVFVPLFFFSSVYSQVSLGYDASNAGLYLLVFFAGFVTAAQFGGRMLDRAGARFPVVAGCLISSVGFALWARHLTDLELDSQWPYIVLAGVGVGLVLGQANTDAVSRAPRSSYGEATGITQTVRNLGASVGLAVLGSILISQNRSHIEDSLGTFGIPKSDADGIANSLFSGSGGGSSEFGAHTGAKAKEVFEAVQLDFAQANRVVFYCMAAVMAVAFVVALLGMPSGRLPDPDEVEETR
ncbi:MAG: MFS transporter [Solirubrobacterales bacterium]|nr:MFS transporter [Solirubrobacterales bacterium]